jgi:hypothetical protein
MTVGLRGRGVNGTSRLDVFNSTSGARECRPWSLVRSVAMEAGQMEPQVYSGVVLLAWPRSRAYLSTNICAAPSGAAAKYRSLCRAQLRLRQTKSEAIKTGLTYEYAKKAAFPFRPKATVPAVESVESRESRFYRATKGPRDFEDHSAGPEARLLVRSQLQGHAAREYRPAD